MHVPRLFGCTPHVTLSLLLGLALGGDALAAQPQTSRWTPLINATPPGQPSSGPGSQEDYISVGYRTYTLGEAKDGSRIWYYLPDTLKNGGTAPVVIYLHGWTAYVPEYYLGQIEHLVSQGYIVLYPQYQKSGLMGILTDLDQTKFLDRAVASVNAALTVLGPVAEADDLVISAHSAGSLLAYCWNGSGAPKARALILNNASLDSDASVPEFVPIQVLEWTACAQSLDVPLFFLTGEEDPLQVDSPAGLNAAVNVPVGAVFTAQSDAHGSPALVADHTAPLVGKTDADTLDYRYYFAGLDQVLAGQTRLSFALGSWSDGVPVIPPELTVQRTP